MVHMDPHQVYRVYANSRDPRTVPKHLLVSQLLVLPPQHNLVTGQKPAEVLLVVTCTVSVHLWMGVKSVKELRETYLD